MADPPYVVGDSAVRFILDQDRVTVHTTRIEGIEPHRDGWRVTDSIGVQHDVNRDGEGAELVPLDHELSQELRKWGDGYEVVQEGRLHGLETVEDPEQELDGGGLEL
jgi:hypothetical protein